MKNHITGHLLSWAPATLAATAAIFIGSRPASATVVISDSFSGSGDLNGTEAGSSGENWTASASPYSINQTWGPAYNQNNGVLNAYGALGSATASVPFATYDSNTQTTTSDYDPTKVTTFSIGFQYLSTTGTGGDWFNQLGFGGLGIQYNYDTSQNGGTPFIGTYGLTGDTTTLGADNSWHTYTITLNPEDQSDNVLVQVAQSDTNSSLGSATLTEATIASDLQQVQLYQQWTNGNSGNPVVNYENFSVDVSSVPEPASLGLTAAAGTLLMARRRRVR
jgi:hypothetical protein